MSRQFLPRVTGVEGCPVLTEAVEKVPGAVSISTCGKPVIDGGLCADHVTEEAASAAVFGGILDLLGIEDDDS